MSDETVPPEDEAAEDPGFEAAVKGVAQGIAGRVKEMVGEFIEDPELEEKGIVQQVEGDLRRAGESPDDDPAPEA